MANKKKNDGIQEIVVSAKRPTTPLKRLKRKLDRASDSYTQWGEENPGTKFVADTFPVSNWGTGVADTLNDAYTGNYAAIPADVLSLVPGAKTAGRAISAGTNAVRNGTSVIDALKRLPSDPRYIRRMQRKMTQVGRLQDSSDAADQTVRNEMGYAKGGAVKKKFEGPEVAVTAPRMSAMERYLYDERQKPEAQRRQEITDTAMGFASPGAAIEGAGLKGLARNASPEFSAGRREFLGNTGKIAAAAAVPNVLKGAASAAEHAAPAVKPVQRTVKQIYEEMYEKGIIDKAQQQAYMRSHMDAGKVAPLRNKDKAILDIIFETRKAAGGSTTLPNNYRKGGRVRMI